VLGRIVVISPHCDDGVFGCGDLLAAHRGSVVVTALAGRPPGHGTLTSWDAASGFGPGENAVDARREEDNAALALLGATPVWLDYCDSQYGHSPTIEQLARALEDVTLGASPSAVFIPLGLFHSDHRLTHAASLLVLRRHPALRWFAYEDAIYRRYPGHLVDERVALLTAAGLRPRSVMLDTPVRSELKRQAVACYRSQLRALSTPGRPGYRDVFEREGFWSLDTGDR
jgi:LmbE family N-acetylglucosaminyl deacetylase